MLEQLKRRCIPLNVLLFHVYIKGMHDVGVYIKEILYMTKEKNANGSWKYEIHQVTSSKIVTSEIRNKISFVKFS